MKISQRAAAMEDSWWLRGVWGVEMEVEMEIEVEIEERIWWRLVPTWQ